MRVEVYGVIKNFKIVESIPTVNNEYGYHFGNGIKEIVTKVTKCDCISTRNDEPIYDYDFFEVETNKTEDDEVTTETYYLAIERDED